MPTTSMGQPLADMDGPEMFHAPVNDVYCGMRGFRKDLYQRLDQTLHGYGLPPR